MRTENTTKLSVSNDQDLNLENLLSVGDQLIGFNTEHLSSRKSRSISYGKFERFKNDLPVVSMTLDQTIDVSISITPTVFLEDCPDILAGNRRYGGIEGIPAEREAILFLRKEVRCFISRERAFSE